MLFNMLRSKFLGPKEYQSVQHSFLHYWNPFFTAQICLHFLFNSKNTNVIFWALQKIAEIVNQRSSALRFFYNHTTLTVVIPKCQTFKSNSFDSRYSRG